MTDVTGYAIIGVPRQTPGTPSTMGGSTVVSFPTTVLVADDGSSSSDAAFDTAAELVLATGSRLAIVHIKSSSPSVVGTTVTPAHRERLRAHGEALIERRTAQAADRGVELGHASVRFARRIEAAVRIVAEEVGCGLLVVGVRGTSAGRRYLSGDLSLRLTRDAPCSVLVVKPGSTDTSHGLDPDRRGGVPE